MSSDQPVKSITSPAVYLRVAPVLSHRARHLGRWGGGDPGHSHGSVDPDTVPWGSLRLGGVTVTTRLRGGKYSARSAGAMGNIL